MPGLRPCISHTFDVARRNADPGLHDIHVVQGNTFSGEKRLCSAEGQVG